MIPPLIRLVCRSIAACHSFDVMMSSGVLVGGLFLSSVGLTVYDCCRSMSMQRFVREYNLRENGLKDRASTGFVLVLLRCHMYTVIVRTQSAEM